MQHHVSPGTLQLFTLTQKPIRNPVQLFTLTEERIRNPVQLFTLTEERWSKLAGLATRSQGVTTTAELKIL